MEQKNKSQKLLFLLPSLNGGGAERVVLMLADYLSDTLADWQVSLVVFSSDGEFRKQIPESLNVIDLKSSRARHTFFKLWRLCKREQPDVVISTMQATTLFGMVRRLLGYHPKWFSRLENPYTYDIAGLNKVTRWLFTKALEQCDGVLVMTKNMVDDLCDETRVQRDKVIIIPNPIELDKIALQAKEANIKHLAKPALVMCGRLVEQKNYPDAIAALSVVREKYINTTLYIIGSGELLEEIKAEAAERGVLEAVRFLGFQDNPFQYIINADVFLLTSQFEGFGNVLVEALVSGVPVVSTDCPTGPREILVDGDYGRLVPMGDIEALADAVCDTLEQSPEMRQLQIEKGIERANDFSIENIGQRYVELFYEYTNS